MINFLFNSDIFMLMWMDGLVGPLASQIFFGITMLGKSYVVATVCLGVIIWFWKSGRAKYIWPLIISVGGSTVTTVVLKAVIGRSRPAEVFAYYAEHSPSFPSGHATVAVALYGFLAYFIYKNFSGWKKNIGVALLSVAIVLIGFSRLYLGVHYLSDVIGGYSVGGLWLCGSTYYFNKISAKRIQ
ncbi:MAG: phosphatase PAP2 family protein [bacterium]|nr:phosphatase PAP2 family protein [bacterium]